MTVATGPTALLLLLACASTTQQVAGPVDATAADSPATLARMVVERFAAGPPEAFDSVYPFPHGRGLVAFAASRDLRRHPGIARVAWTDDDRAILVLSGYVEFGNTGDETIYAEGFSGLYEAVRRESGLWSLSQRLALDSAGTISTHALAATVVPGAGLDVRDTLEISVRSAYGLAVRLNHAARISRVLLDGAPAAHEFGGGLLWFQVPGAGRAELVLEYQIDVAQDSAAGANSGRFEPEYGHVRNQYYWHARGEAPSHYSLTVRAPAGYRVATDLPQVDTVAGAVRTVRARSGSAVPALSLFYDRHWDVEFRQAGRLRLAVFATPEFRPAPDSLASAFARVHRLLSDRFGEPRGGYTAVVQGRAREGAGWLYLSNNAIVAAAQGGAPIQAGPVPRAYFGHEVAHAWTEPAGAAANLLSEGWATFAEALLLREQYGAEVERAFWEHQRNRYHTGGFEGRSILDDPLNSGIAYHKGAWIFRMLRHVMGEAEFQSALREYMRTPAGEPAGLEAFTRALSRAAGRDMTDFLRPWVEETTIPAVVARVEGRRLIVTQQEPVFRLPLEVDLITASGPVRRTLLLTSAADTLDIRDVGAVTAALVDPEHRFLLRRQRGEIVRFELRAPDAERVALAGDFSSSPVAATLEDGVWRVSLPLTAGRYTWSWMVDGRQVESGIRVVQPERELEAAYPR